MIQEFNAIGLEDPEDPSFYYVSHPYTFVFAQSSDFTKISSMIETFPLYSSEKTNFSLVIPHTKFLIDLKKTESHSNFMFFYNKNAVLPNSFEICKIAERT